MTPTTHEIDGPIEPPAPRSRQRRYRREERHWYRDESNAEARWHNLSARQRANIRAKQLETIEENPGPAPRQALRRAARLLLTMPASAATLEVEALEAPVTRVRWWHLGRPTAWMPCDRTTWELVVLLAGTTGWMRDLTQEGVEPNPGPDSDDDQWAANRSKRQAARAALAGLREEVDECLRSNCPTHHHLARKPPSGQAQQKAPETENGKNAARRRARKAALQLCVTNDIPTPVPCPGRPHWHLGPGERGTGPPQQLEGLTCAAAIAACTHTAPEDGGASHLPEPPKPVALPLRPRPGLSGGGKKPKDAPKAKGEHKRTPESGAKNVSTQKHDKDADCKPEAVIPPPIAHPVVPSLLPHVIPLMKKSKERGDVLFKQPAAEKVFPKVTPPSNETQGEQTKTAAKTSEPPKAKAPPPNPIAAVAGERPPVPKGYKVVPTRSDGSCWYHSLVELAWGPSSAPSMRLMRALIALAWLDHPPVGCNHPAVGARRIAYTNAWAGEEQISVSAKALDARIIVYSNARFGYGDIGKPVLRVYHTGGHFEALVPLQGHSPRPLDPVRTQAILNQLFARIPHPTLPNPWADPGKWEVASGTPASTPAPSPAPPPPTENTDGEQIPPAKSGPPTGKPTQPPLMATAAAPSAVAVAGVVKPGNAGQTASSPPLPAPSPPVVVPPPPTAPVTPLGSEPESPAGSAPVGTLVAHPRHRHFSEPEGPYNRESRVEVVPVFYVDQGTPVGNWIPLLVRLNRFFVHLLPHWNQWAGVSEASTPHRVTSAERTYLSWFRTWRGQRIAAPDVPHHINPLERAGYKTYIPEEVYLDAVDAFWCDPRTNALAIGNSDAGVNISFVASATRYITTLYEPTQCGTHARRLAATARLIANIATVRCHFGSASLPSRIPCFRQDPTTSLGVSGLASRKS